jgi:hypothetical protein
LTAQPRRLSRNEGLETSSRGGVTPAFARGDSEETLTAEV